MRSPVITDGKYSPGSGFRRSSRLLGFRHDVVAVVEDLLRFRFHAFRLSLGLFRFLLHLSGAGFVFLTLQSVGFRLFLLVTFGNAAGFQGETEKDQRDDDQKQTKQMREKTQGQKSAQDSSNSPSGTLPKIDGVSYKNVQAEDGRMCVVANGNTLDKKELLKAAGFKWNSQQKVWWKYAATA